MQTQAEREQQEQQEQREQQQRRQRAQLQRQRRMQMAKNAARARSLRTVNGEHKLCYDDGAQETVDDEQLTYEKVAAHSEAWEKDDDEARWTARNDGMVSDPAYFQRQAAQRLRQMAQNKLRGRKRDVNNKLRYTDGEEEAVDDDQLEFEKDFDEAVKDDEDLKFARGIKIIGPGFGGRVVGQTSPEDFEKTLMDLMQRNKLPKKLSRYGALPDDDDDDGANGNDPTGDHGSSGDQGNAQGGGGGWSRTGISDTAIGRRAITVAEHRLPTIGALGELDGFPE